MKRKNTIKKKYIKKRKRTLLKKKYINKRKRTLFNILIKEKEHY
jgi:hypothetical protein